MTTPDANSASASSKIVRQHVTLSRVRISVQTDAGHQSNSQHMKAPSILKTCPHCDGRFYIPLVRSSSVRELLLVHFPCPHCGFTNWPYHVPIGEQACKGCGTPFWLEAHHARGYSKRCYRRLMGYP